MQETMQEIHLLVKKKVTRKPLHCKIGQTDQTWAPADLNGSLSHHATVLFLLEMCRHKYNIL